MIRSLLVVVLATLVFAASGSNHVQAQTSESPPPASSTSDTIILPMEPPFPEPFDVLSTGERRIHVLSEKFDATRSYSTSEAFVDLDLGKATYVETTKDGSITTHYDSNSGTIYRYKPFSCETYEYQKFPIDIDTNSLNFANLKHSIDAKYDMYLFGVLAIWQRAASQEKSYSRISEQVYSASKAVFDSAHKWTIRQGDAGSGVFAHLYFFETNWSSGDELPHLTLETIEIEDTNQKTIVTINILSAENDIDDEAYDRELQLPLMYGCSPKGAADDDDVYKLQRILLTTRDYVETRLKLEVVATKVEAGDKQASDIISFESVYSPYEDYIDGTHAKYWMLRQRGSKIDSKTVLDLQSNVRWDIDLLRGGCTITNTGRPIYNTDNQHELNLQFSNGLKLAIDKELLDKLLVDLTGFKVIKNVEENLVEYVYVTRDTRDLFGENKLNRVVRKYSYNEEESGELVSVTVWILADDETRVLERYHFTIIGAANKMTGPEKARLFDVSEDCYLDNEAMKYGIDYAWLELYYPVPANMIDFVPSMSIKLRDFFYGSVLKGQDLSYFRAPKIEFMFDETGFTMRMLLLDSPPLHLVYYKMESRTINPDASAGDLVELAPDIKHCSELCRLHRCTAMSYCEATFSCILTNAEQKNLEKKFFTSVGCNSYAHTRDTEDLNLFETKLQNVIARFHQIDYRPIELPEMPQELENPPYASAGEGTAQFEILGQYINKISDLILKRDVSSMSAISLMFGRLLVLVPSSFRVERDPLEEFGLANKDELELAPNQLPPFHQGLNQHRYNFRAFEDSSNDDGQKTDARRYMGVDYDQCALACVDGKCQSFSYCRQRQECIITNIYDIKSNEQKYVQTDADCLIAQRDFLSKFSRFPEVNPPDGIEGKRLQAASNPSECAHSCVLETSFNCLGFTYCKGKQAGADSGGQCAYSESRALASTQTAAASYDTGCDHYSRSYLADFVRIEYRQLDEETLANLSTSLIEGQSVDKCAEICATQLLDCSAFQFCFDPEANNAKARQQCTMIESPPADGRETWKVVLDQAGRVVSAGKLFASNQNCHVFSMRKGSSEAELRRLAFEPLSVDEQDSEAKQAAAGGLTLLGCLMLFVCTTVALSLVGLGFMLAQQNSARLRERIDHLRALYMRY